MQALNRQTVVNTVHPERIIQVLNRQTVVNTLHPERIIQFGEGNFLRAFVDWMVARMNEETAFNAGVVVVQPIAQGMAEMVNRQDGLYTLVLKGLENGEPVFRTRLVDCITRALNPYADFAAYLALADQPQMRFIVSNTTEAGIVFCADDAFGDAPAKTFPGKLTQLLHRRFTTFGGAADKGFILLPCELIDRNGDALKRCVLQYADLWQLGAAFTAWIETANIFCNTLVDRIVPGYPRETVGEILEKVGYDDKLVVEGEVFHLWVIEGPEAVRLAFPADRAGLNVLFVPSMKPYRDRKVTLLNTPHTLLSPVGLLAGLETVRESVEDADVGAFVRRVMFDELIPALDLPVDELTAFAEAVLDRFRNPFVKHQMTSIMLNAFPKYKTRVLPSLKVYVARRGCLPQGMVLGLAALCVYYRGGTQGGCVCAPNDEAAIVELLRGLWATGDAVAVARGVLAATSIWGEDLNAVPGLADALAARIAAIEADGMRKALQA